jgi:hypothetical protein
MLISMEPITDVSSVLFSARRVLLLPVAALARVSMGKLTIYWELFVSSTAERVNMGRLVT